jgi:hypothetical protein
VIRDPFYQAIVEKLKAPLDGNIFEASSNSLLRNYYPTLVPIPGGTDSGMDGATADSGPFLICTTQSDVIRNLTKSIQSYLRSGGLRREVILATSQALTPTKRANLENRARELGFHMKQIYERAAIAEFLYNESRWCKELLGLSGRPSALTVFPQTERPLLDLPLVGREGLVEKLQSLAADCLIIGAPGSGKTFLLRTLALSGSGLFLVDSDKAAITEAIRDQQPQAIFVDDAHFHLDVLSMLRHIRSEIRANFSIIAVSWEGDKDRIAETLSLTSSQVIRLGLLTRDEIVEVIKHVGIAGPVELVREIVDQAEGRPGLAVTLSFLCLQGDIRRVVYGESLTQTLGQAFQRLIGQEANHILAAFALGGDRGMQLESVSCCLGISLIDLQVRLSRLAAGGVIREGTPDFLSVWPKALRYVLVRDTFYNGVCKLPIIPLMQEVPDQAELVKTLIESARRGAVIPNLREMVKSTGSVQVLRAYASLGISEARYVLSNYSEQLPHIGRSILGVAPEYALPMLFDKAIGDERELHNTLDHTLRWVQDWIHEVTPGNIETTRRRKLLMEAVERWLNKRRDESVALRALCLALTPTFESNYSDPGGSNIFNIWRGLLTHDELAGVGELWNKAIELLKSFSNIDWPFLFRAIHEWMHPRMGMQATVPDNSQQLIDSITEKVLRSIAEISAERPGVQQEIREISNDLGFDISTMTDDDFEVLFPTEDFKNYEEWQRQQEESIHKLAADWRSLSHDETTSRIMRLEHEAAIVAKSYPRNVPSLCEELADTCDQPVVWADNFIKKGLPADTVFPFLRKAIQREEQGWQDLLRKCFNKDQYTRLAVAVTLSLANPSPDLLEQMSAHVEHHADYVKGCCLRREVPDQTLALLLRHANPTVSTAAAIGEWLTEPQGKVRDSVINPWREAILRTNVREYWLSQILKQDGSLCFEWLLASIEREEWFFIHDFRNRDRSETIISALIFEQRLAILEKLQDHHSFYDLVEELVDDDLGLYTELLKREGLSNYHLLPLEGHPIGAWIDKALLAHEAGYGVDEIISAAFGFSYSWEGKLSDMWRTWLREFDQLSEHNDPRVREIAAAGSKAAHERIEDAAASERTEAIFGRQANKLY